MSLTDRAVEMQTLTGLVESAVRGEGAFAIVEGAHGIGKSALLEFAVDHAASVGVRVVRFDGQEFKGDHALFLLDRLLELLAPNPDVVAGRFPARPSTRRDSLNELAVAAFEYSARAPVLVVVDDAHWVDEPSIESLARLMLRLRPRREEGEEVRVAVLMATVPRVDAPAALRSLAAAVPDAWIRPGLLGRDAAAVIVTAHLGAEVGSRVLVPLVEASGGNPMLLHELSEEIQRRGLDATRAVSEIPTLAPVGVMKSMERHLARLSPSAVEAAKALAVLDRSAGLAAIAEVARLETAAMVTAALALRSEGIIAGDSGAIRFAHPATRVAVHSAIDEVERALLHHRAASVLLAHGGGVDEISAHLLHAPLGLEAALVDVLRTAADQARRSGASGAATRLLRRLARELQPGDERDAVLVDLGTVGSAAGIPDADEHLNAVLRRHDSGPIHERASLGLARVLRVRGHSVEAIEVLGALVSGKSLEPELTQRASLELLALGTTNRRARRLLDDQFHALTDTGAPPADAAEAFKLSLMAWMRGMTGEAPAATVVDLARRALTYPTVPAEPTRVAGPTTILAAMALVTVDELDEAYDAQSQVVEAARGRDAPVEESIGLSLRAWVDWRRGELAGAELDARRAIELARQHSAPHMLVASALGVSGLVAVQRSDDPVVLALVEEELATEPHDSEGTSECFLLHARGLLRLRQGDVAGALGLLMETGESQDAWAAHNPALLPWRGEVARVLAALGRWDEASGFARVELDRAESFGADRAVGVALGAMAAATEAQDERLDLLQAAATTLERTRAKLDAANAFVELGIALRRMRRIPEARDALRQGEDLALACGATVLVTRAQHELMASGTQPRRVAVEGVEALTPTERRVAELAAAGHTNRLIAQQLHVSLKTVESHLSHVYSKLKVDARNEIAAALQTD